MSAAAESVPPCGGASSLDFFLQTLEPLEMSSGGSVVFGGIWGVAPPEARSSTGGWLAEPRCAGGNVGAPQGGREGGAEGVSVWWSDTGGTPVPLLWEREVVRRGRAPVLGRDEKGDLVGD